MEDLIEVLDLLQSAQFTTGLRFGLIALAIGWALWLLFGRGRGPLPMVGLLITLALGATLFRVEDSIAAELPALGAILAGALIARLPQVPGWAQPLLVAPGAVWLAFATPVTDLTWVRVLIALLIPIAGFAINDFEKRHAGMGLGVIFYTLAVMGVFLGVPDTEWAVALLAVALTATFLAWPKVAGCLGSEGAYLAVALLLLVSAQGGGARPPSIIGSAACLGLLLLEPLILVIKPSAVRVTTWFNRTPAGAVLASIPQLLVVLLCSRIASRFSAYLPAVLVVALIYAITVAIGLWAPERMITAQDEPDEERSDELFPGDIF